MSNFSGPFSICLDKGLFFALLSQTLFLGVLMVVRPNKKLKMHLFEKNITQRQLAFGTGYDESLVSKAVKYGRSTPEMREKISRFLNIEEKELFPWDA